MRATTGTPRPRAGPDSPQCRCRRTTSNIWTLQFHCSTDSRSWSLAHGGKRTVPEGSGGLKMDTFCFFFPGNSADLSRLRLFPDATSVPAAVIQPLSACISCLRCATTQEKHRPRTGNLAALRLGVSVLFRCVCLQHFVSFLSFLSFFFLMSKLFSAQQSADPFGKPLICTP